MNPEISKHLLYYPITLIKGEMVFRYLKYYRYFQYFDKKQILDYKTNAISKILNFAYSNSKFYKKLYDLYDIKPSDFKTIDDLSKFPTISKQDLVDNEKDIKIDSRFSFLNSKKTTGGSTGRAVSIYKNPSALARERAATWRSYEWAGVTVGSPQARFWGIPLTNLNQLKSKVIDFVSNRIRFSAFAISEENFEQFFIDLHKFRPEYLYGYASFIHEFAFYLNKFSKSLPSSVKSVITTSEVLTQEIRNDIQSILGLNVFNEYGCGEVGSIAHECENGMLHIMEDNLYVEIDSQNNQSDEGEIIVTDFFNTAMPLIRYKLEDFAKISNKTKCDCGKTLKVIDKVYGRAYDMLYTSDGKKIHPEYIMYIFEALKEKYPSVKQFQAVQNHIDAIEINIVKDSNYDFSAEQFVRERLREKLGVSTMIKFHYVDTIPRETSGKLRLVKSIL